MKQFITALLLIICLEGFSQQPIFIADGANIYSLDLANCTSRFIGKSSVPAFNDIAFTPDGKLWGIYSGLYQIDTTNAVATYIGYSEGTEGVSLVALNDSILLDEVEDSLWGINVKTAQSYNIGKIGYEAAGDLSWLGNVLYMTTENQLIKIVLNDTYSSILSATPVNTVNDPIPTCDGLATVSFNGSDSLVGFYGPYIFNQINGTYQQVCVPQLQIGADGAASMTFPSLLPVHLLNFSYALLNKAVQLKWQAMTEINSDYFSIQRSSDGVHFTTIGKQSAADNSNSLKQYSFTDNKPLNVNYYRLQEVDLNGNTTYSKVLLVKLPQANALTIIQNPVQNILQVQVNSGEQNINSLTIFDFTGRRIKTVSVQNGLQSIDVSSLPSRTYILQLITEDGQVFNRPLS